MRQKHPAPRDVHAEALLPAMEKQDIHPVLFDRLTGASIRSAALKSTGSAGPWEWMLLAGEDYAAHFTKSPTIYVQPSLLLPNE